MNEFEYLEWIATHLVSFRPMPEMAYITFLDDRGFQHEITVGIDSENPSDLEILTKAIDKAVEICKLPANNES